MGLVWADLRIATHRVSLLQRIGDTSLGPTPEGRKGRLVHTTRDLGHVSKCLRSWDSFMGFVHGIRK